MLNQCKKTNIVKNNEMCQLRLQKKVLLKDPQICTKNYTKEVNFLFQLLFFLLNIKRNIYVIIMKFVELDESNSWIDNVQSKTNKSKEQDNSSTNSNASILNKSGLQKDER